MYFKGYTTAKVKITGLSTDSDETVVYVTEYLKLDSHSDPLAIKSMVSVDSQIS